VCAVCGACIEEFVRGAGESANCPVCKRKLGVAPFSSGELRFDRALTALCMHIFPRAGDKELMAEAETRAQELRVRTQQQAATAESRKPAARTGPAPSHKKRRPGPPGPNTIAAAIAESLRPPPPPEAAPSVEAASVVYEVRPLPHVAVGDQAYVAALERPYVRTPLNLSAQSLGRYIASKCTVTEGWELQVCTPQGEPVHPLAPLIAFMHKGQPAEGAASGMPVVYFRLVAAV